LFAYFETHHSPIRASWVSSCAKARHASCLAIRVCSWLSDLCLAWKRFGLYATTESELVMAKVHRWTYSGIPSILESSSYSSKREGFKETVMMPTCSSEWAMMPPNVEFERMYEMKRPVG
jgi:hypothetical protein